MASLTKRLKRDPATRPPNCGSCRFHRSGGATIGTAAGGAPVYGPDSTEFCILMAITEEDQGRILPEGIDGRPEWCPW